MPGLGQSLVVRVLVTRAAEDAGPLVRALRAEGLQPVCVPLLQRVYRVDAVRRAWASSEHDLVVFTSAAAVVASQRAGVSPRCDAAVVGPKTASAAINAGWRVVAQPSTALASELLTSLSEHRARRIFYPRADLAPDDVRRGLEALNAVVTEVVAYDNRLPNEAADQLRRCWPVDVVTLLSGSAARRFSSILPDESVDIQVVAIGPSTARVASQAGLTVSVVADPHTVEGVVAAVIGLG
ncbi:MAG: uroporphyrinogen-III synthase [Kiritimatiellia bacterium]|jgi:uroporphyrinogen-III synthase